MFALGKGRAMRLQVKGTAGSRANIQPVHLERTSPSIGEPILELRFRPLAQIKVQGKMPETVILANPMAKMNGRSRKDSG